MKKKANRKKTKPQEIISKAGRTVSLEVNKMRLHYAVREQQIYQQAAQLIVTAGADILQKQHDFTPEQSAEWATATLRAARGIVEEVVGEKETSNE